MTVVQRASVAPMNRPLGKEFGWIGDPGSEGIGGSDEIGGGGGTGPVGSDDEIINGGSIL